MPEGKNRVWVFEVKQAAEAPEPNADGRYVAYRWQGFGPFATRDEADAARREQMAIHGPTCVTHVESRKVPAGRELVGV